MYDICEVCNSPLRGKDLEDGVTIAADCCERCGLCAHCRQEGNHDCDEE